MNKLSRQSVSNSRSSVETPAAGCPVDGEKKRYHRVAAARQAQGISVTTAAQRLGWSRQRAVAAEDEAFDLTISELLQWQDALDVPLQELIVEPDQTLSRPVMERAQLLRLMKTTRSLGELVTSKRAKRLISRLSEQLVEIMPELRDARPWPAHQESRSCEFGIIAERTFTSSNP